MEPRHFAAAYLDHNHKSGSEINQIAPVGDTTHRLVQYLRRSYDLVVPSLRYWLVAQCLQEISTS